MHRNVRGTKSRIRSLHNFRIDIMTPPICVVFILEIYLMKFDHLRCLSLLAIFMMLAVTTCQSIASSHGSDNDLIQTANKISRLIADNHYNPSELQRPEYIALEKKMMKVAASAKSKDEFIQLFNDFWRNGPFSHVSLAYSERDAAATADFFDTFSVGGNGAVLARNQDVAILTVNTMMGVDTIEEINAAYAEIVKKGAKALIIDLRNNEGGAFAIVPLVSHLLTEPIDAGFFVSSKWNVDGHQQPTFQDVKNLTPWTGWSIKSFWHDVQTVPLTRIQFLPVAPYFEGPVYVLTSKISASATEFATDALANLSSVTIIGEPTAGKMLSQKMFDVGENLQLALPIAEYYSTRIGRIEGKGVVPDIVVSASEAMNVALGIIAGADPKTLVRKFSSKKNSAISVLSDEKLYLFGSMNQWGKNWNNTPKFEYLGEGIYEAKIKLKKGSWEFKIAPMNWSFDLGAMDDNEVMLEGEVKSLVKKKGSQNLITTVNTETEFMIHLDVNDDRNMELRLNKL